MVDSTRDSKILLSKIRERDGSTKLTCISRLLSNYLFSVHYEKSTNTINYGIKSNVWYNKHTFKPYIMQSNFDGYQLEKI